MTGPAGTAPVQEPRVRLAAVVLTGGTASRMGGVDKGSIRLRGRSLLERALAATVAAGEVVVVGDPVRTSRPVAWTVEAPAKGGPAAGVLAGVDALSTAPELVAVLAVDMPLVDAGTLRRLADAVGGSRHVDGAVLVDEEGRRQPLAAVYRYGALVAARPARAEDVTGLPMQRLVAGLRLAEVPAVRDEARDVDTWDDLTHLARPDPLAGSGAEDHAGGVTLHDWIDELCDALDIEAEVDEGLVLDLARDAAHNVERAAAPLTTYLLGFAAAQQQADPTRLEQLAAAATDLAERWGGTEDEPVDDTDDDTGPDAEVGEGERLVDVE
jgi:molybdopterin-guanine dinucleotide biosynthesis protein A